MYQRRLSQQRDERLKKRNRIVSRLFDEHDTGLKGYLTVPEAKKFFCFVFELEVADKKEDRIRLAKLMKLCDP
jgi:hypothetical protein